MPTINANTDAIGQFARKLRKAAPETSKALRGSILSAANEVRDAARAEAATFSKTIPGTIRSSASGNTGKVTAGSSKVPIAALYERSSAFRHPVYGNKKTWVTQPGSPNHYLTGTAAKMRTSTIATISEAVMAAIDTVVGGDA